MGRRDAGGERWPIVAVQLMPAPEQVKQARIAAGLSARESGAMVGVSGLTWQRWEGQSSRTTEIPYAHWNLFLLLTGSHPIYRLEKKMLTREQVAAMNGEAYAKKLDQAIEYATGLNWSAVK